MVQWCSLKNAGAVLTKGLFLSQVSSLQASEGAVKVSYIILFICLVVYYVRLSSADSSPILRGVTSRRSEKTAKSKVEKAE